MWFTLVSISRSECPVPQLDNVRRFSHGDEYSLPVVLPAPQHSALTALRDLHRLRPGRFDQGREAHAECPTDPQQGPNARVRGTLLDVDQHAATHPGSFRQLVQGPSTQPALLFDAGTDGGRKFRSAFFHKC